MKAFEWWKPIPGYEGIYLISDLGRVRSLPRTRNGKSGCKVFVMPRFLKFQKLRGYLKVDLYRNEEKTTFLVHRLVKNTFHGYSELDVDHENTIKTDNRLINLRYGTERQNSIWHSEKHTHSSKHTGVTWHKRDKKWQAAIHVNGKAKHLGYFVDESQAGDAYKKALVV